MSRNKKKNYTNTIVFVVVLLIVFASLLRKQNWTVIPQKIICTDIHTKNSAGVQGTRAWRDYYRNPSCLNYSVSADEYSHSTDLKHKFNPLAASVDTYAEYYGAIYEHIVNSDQKLITDLTDSLLTLKEINSYSRDRFAEVIVSMVQDIEYAYITTEATCPGRYTSLNCAASQAFGVHTPSEFMYTLLGDCDTRCILLYGILDQLGYDPKIAISRVYEHAMLLVDISGPGDFLKFRGKNYYFWETTARGWKPGVLPPSSGNKNYWDIALH